MRLSSLCIGVSMLVMAPGVAGAQSFNCGRATSAAEVTICRSDNLAALDERMARLYRRLERSMTGPIYRSLVIGQQQWLSDRDACGFNAGCLASAYRRRIAELEDY